MPLYVRDDDVAQLARQLKDLTGVRTVSGFGKAMGHKAALNAGDCFVYACAQAYRLPLLCKGDLFPRTDIPLA